MSKQLVVTPLALSVILCASLAWAQDPSLLPKYGSLPKPEWQKQADAAFISGMDKDYHGDRKKASSDMAARGWQFLAQGEPETAMRRFNQAWLLDHDDGIALWGMAAIEADWGKFDESLKLFAEAEKFSGEQINFSVDYAAAVGRAGVKEKNDVLLKEAFDRFEAVYEKAPQNTRNLQNWAMTLFGIGKYSEAWEKVKLAEAAPNKPQLNPAFLADLQARMPRPKN